MRARIQLLALAVIAGGGMSLSAPPPAVAAPIEDPLYCCWDFWSNACCHPTGCMITSEGCVRITKLP